MSLRLVLALAALSSLPACSRHAATPDVLCTVDGVGIHEADVEYRLRTGGHGGVLTPESRKNLLESIIAEQLLSQRAVELGFDADPSYREAVRQLEAQVAAVKRKRLAEIFSRKEVSAKVDVSEADARRYFDDHKEELRTELHVLQIFRRSEPEIQKAAALLASGVAFDEVARGAATTSDLGYLKWQEMPEVWRAPLAALSNGGISKVLQSGKDRFWIIQLVDRRQGAELAFESVKSALIDRLRASGAEQRRAEVEAELRRRAKIVYTTP